MHFQKKGKLFIQHPQCNVGLATSAHWEDALLLIVEFVVMETQLDTLLPCCYENIVCMCSSIIATAKFRKVLTSN